VGGTGTVGWGRDQEGANQWQSIINSIKMDKNIFGSLSNISSLFQEQFIERREFSHHLFGFSHRLSYF
jgi:hypothetical protein